MLNRITSAVFNVAVLLVAAASAVWLTITGHTLLLEGMLVALGAVLAAVIFGMRLAGGFGTDRLSIWAGPLWKIRLSGAQVAPGHFPRLRDTHHS